VPFWQDLVNGIDKPIIDTGLIKQHLMRGTGYFEPTPLWNQERSSDWLRSMPRKEEADRRA
jgi:hypothetical protein